MPAPSYGTFVKDGDAKIAYSPADVITLQFDGWRLEDGPPTHEPSDPTEDDGPVPPPKGGAGSGRDAWAEYATAHRVPLTDGARDDIIAALDAAGVPTE